MAATIRISRRSAQRILEMLDGGPGVYGPEHDHAEMELKVALAAIRRKAEKKRPARLKKSQRQQAKRVARASVYELVAGRAGNTCECGCGTAFGPPWSLTAAPQMDHFFGKARFESVDTVWMLRKDCHDAKTLNHPSASGWLRKFIKHCEAHGYHQAAERACADLESAELLEQAAEISRNANTETPEGATNAEGHRQET